MKDYKILPVSEYIDRTTAGFLGQLVGFFSGYEFVFTKDKRAHVGMPDEWFEMCNGPYANPNPHKQHSDKLLFNEESGLWEAWNDDDYSIDILNQYIIKDMYEQYGTVTSKVITDGWAKYNVYDMGGGNRKRGAYALMSGRRYLPEFAGAWEFGNRYSYCFEPCIENETIGMNAPGMPNTTAKITELFAAVTSDQDPVVYARFYAVMYSLAYFEHDIQKLIRTAQRVLPSKSFASYVVDECFALKEEFLNDWRAAVREAEKRFALTHDRMVHDFMLEPNVNTAFVLLSLLYGEGNYVETCKIVSLAGYDGDSTSAICMGIMGIICKMAELPKEAHELLWQNGEGVIVNLPYRGVAEGYWMCALGLPERIKITDIVKLYQENFEKILIENGGKIENGCYYIPTEELAHTDNVYYEDFDKNGLSDYTVNGKAELFSGGFEGINTVKLSGEIYTAIKNLCVGDQYRVTAYINTSENERAELFVRANGRTEAYATVYSEPRYIRRSFVFTATSPEMEFGMKTSSQGGFATLDHVCISRINSKKIAICTFDGDTVTVNGRFDKEVFLRIVFENTADENVDVAVSVNGDSFNCAPFYKTGRAAENTADATYIPLLLTSDVNTITLSKSNEDLTFISAEIVSVTDLH